MDIEQLKLVLEAINSVGGEAKEFGFWWLAFRMVPPVLWFIFGMTAVFVISNRVRQSVVTQSAAHAVAKELGHKVFIDWSSVDTVIVLEQIRALKEFVNKAEAQKKT